MSSRGFAAAGLKTTLGQANVLLRSYLLGRGVFRCPISNLSGSYCESAKSLKADLQELMSDSIPILCDRCGATGIAGLADFSDLGNLLEFSAVPRQLKRSNGWTPVLQREFIARLALTGSPTLAVEAMGKNLHGVRKLLKDPGSDSFRAWERAVELGEGAEARRRIAELAELHQRAKHLTGTSRRGRDFEPEPAAEEEDTTAFRMELVERLVAKWQRKVGQERESRLEGEVVAADFYLRQITCLEVAFDLMIEGHGDRSWTMLVEARRGTRNVLEIADTYMARVLDQARRDHWAAMDEPDRPLLWPERYLLGDVSKVDARTEPLEATGKASRPAAGYALNEWCQMDPAEQQRIYDEQHRRDAEEQVEWEAAARREYEERRDSGASSYSRDVERPAAAKPRDGNGFTPLPEPEPEPEDELDDNGEDFADRAMREAIAAAKRAHPEDFD